MRDEDELPAHHPQPIHPYLQIWLRCRRYPNTLTGAPALPGPGLTILEQDAELMLAFDLLEAAYKDIHELLDREREARKKVEARMQELLAGQASS